MVKVIEVSYLRESREAEVRENCSVFSYIVKESLPDAERAHRGELPRFKGSAFLNRGTLFSGIAFPMLFVSPS